jgi:phospholipase/carboxylesterase
MHKRNIVTSGNKLNAAGKVLIMLHGRGATAGDILSVSAHLSVNDYSLIAPQATNNTWYPNSFLAPPTQNEPWLSSALEWLKEILDDLTGKRIPTEQIYFTGFSQGACLTLEFIARNATRYGGVAAFTGGLIGDRIYRGNYKGDFKNTPVFIASGNPDPHVPVERVYATANILKEMNARVMEKIYNNMGHTINQDEIDQANQFIFKKEKKEPDLE